MTNSDIRAHLRKGELAVELLEKMGYTYGPNVFKGPGVWQKPVEDQILAPVIAAFQKMVAEEVSKRAPEPVSEQVKTGDRFVINYLPPGHRLHQFDSEWKSRVFTARAVERRFGCTTIVARFGLNCVNHGYWIPVEHITKVPSNADF